MPGANMLKCLFRPLQYAPRTRYGFVGEGNGLSRFGHGLLDPLFQRRRGFHSKR
jgi:hypothetical protein